MTTTLKKAAEALALAAPAAVEAEMLPGDAERMFAAGLRAIRVPSKETLIASDAMHPENERIWLAMIDSIINGEG